MFKNLRAYDVIANNKLYQSGKPVTVEVLPAREILENTVVGEDVEGNYTAQFYPHYFNSKSVNEGNIDIGSQIAVLVAAIKEQQKEIELLKAMLKV